MRSFRAAGAVAIVVALAGSACGLDETGILDFDASGRTDATPTDGPGDDGGPPHDARPAKDRTAPDAGGDGAGSDGPTPDVGMDAGEDALPPGDALIDVSTDSASPDVTVEGAAGDGPLDAGIDADSSTPDAGADGSADSGADVDGAVDASADVAGEAAADSGADSGAVDGSGDAPVDAGGYACDGGATADCLTGCPGSPVSCLYCGPLSGTSGFCGPEGTACTFDNPPSGYGACTCLSASDCPGDDQLCEALTCRSCGEPGTNNHACKGGGKCHQVMATCK